MTTPLIQRIKRNLTDLELTKSFVEQKFCFSGVAPDKKKLMKKCMVEVLEAAAAKSEEDSAVVALWEAREQLESIIIVAQPCTRIEIYARKESAPEPKPWQILLPSLEGMDENWIKFVLAHEFSHGLLKDTQVPTSKLGEAVSQYTEWRADALAGSWGFNPIPEKEEKKEEKKAKSRKEGD